MHIPQQTHKATPKTSKKVPIKYSQDGAVLSVHIKQSIYVAVQEAKGALEGVSGKDFSTSILARRALARYTDYLLLLSPEQLQSEASDLYHSYR